MSRIKPIWILLIIAVVVGVIFWSVGGSEIVDEAPYYIKKIVKETAEVTIRGEVIEAEIARTPEARAKGLSGRERLPSGRGMLFVFEESELHAFTMKDTLISLDMVWIDDGIIVHIEHRAQPGVEIIDPQVPASYVLEVNGGVAETHGWQVSDVATITFDK